MIYRWISALLFAATAMADPAPIEVYIRQAFATSLELQIAGLEYGKSTADLIAAKAPFVPGISFGPGLSKQIVPSSRSIQGVSKLDNTTASYNLHLEKQSELGTTIDFGLDGSRSDSNDKDARIDPLNEQTLSLSLTQPLLSDFGDGSDRLTLRLSRLGAKLTSLQQQQVIQEFVSELSNLYLEFYFADRERTIKAESFERANIQFERTRDHISQGLLPENDIHVVEENLLRCRGQLDEANSNLTRKSARLLSYLGIDHSKRPNDLPKPSLDIPKEPVALPYSLAFNYQSQSQDILIAMENFRHDHYRNQGLPRLDLTGSLSLSGIDETMGGSFDRLVGFDGYGGQVLFSFSSPLERAAQKSRAAASSLELKRLRLVKRQLIRNLKTERADLIADFVDKRRSYELSGRIHDLAGKKLADEEGKYRLGLSTLNNIVQFQRELAEASSLRDRALVDWYRSALAIDRIDGRLCQRFGLDPGSNIGATIE